jgi:chitin disaccharide deacetylase
MARDPIRLLVRGDDFASTHAANVAGIECYRNGVVRSVEIMVPCPWFEEGCRLLNENPGLDAGVHLVLTSEWDEYRWRPLTHCPSITDEAGCFLPRVWPSEGAPGKRALVDADWRRDEVEAELRAQIDLCLARVPYISHLTGHMGWENAHLDLAGMFWRLADDYGLQVSTSAEPMTLMDGYDKSGSSEDHVRSFVADLERLTPGAWMFIEHPAYDHPEMEGVHHAGYEDVGGDRGGVTRVLTSPEVLRTVAERGITLISYRDLRVIQS